MFIIVICIKNLYLICTFDKISRKVWVKIDDLGEIKSLKYSYFTLMDFSAKWDPIPTMICQNHTQIVKGFMGQTTAFAADKIKSNVLLMGECKINGEARDIHGQIGKGKFTYYGGHDPEDYQHRVGDAPTVLDLHPNSPGYRLILNNVLFPAARKKKLKT